MGELAIIEEVKSRGIVTEVWSALKNSIFPGAADHSVLMAWDYCAARELDIMLKPVHLVPMWIKDKNENNKGSMRDVVMPGIGLYRIQADRSGNYAGMSEPTFGPEKTVKLDGLEVTFPEWCQITVSKLLGDRVVDFTAREYWLENYATAGDTAKPNAMWFKRPRGQLIKCTEAQALRKAWPETGSQPTAEEMEGKEIDISQRTTVKREQPKAIEYYPQEKFDINFPKWADGIKSGRKTAEQVITTISSKAALSQQQIDQINAVEVSK